MVPPRRATALCSVVRLVKRREGLGVQSLADHSNLLLSGCKAFVFNGIKRFQDCPSSRSYRVQGRHVKVGTPELQRNNKKNANQVEFIKSFAQ